MRTRSHADRFLLPARTCQFLPLLTAGLVASFGVSTIAQTTRPTSMPAEAPAAGPGGDSVTEADARASFLLEQRGAIAEMRQEFPVAKARRIDEIVRLSIEDGSLVAHVVADDLGDMASVPITDANAVATINYIGVADGAVGRTLNLIYLRLDEADASRPRATFIQLMNGFDGLRLSLHDQAPLLGSSGELTDQPRPPFDPDAPPMAKLRFERSDELDAAAGANGHAQIAQPQRLELSGRNFAEMLDADHDAIVDAMAEGFTSLRAMHVLSGLSEPQARQLLLGQKGIDPEVARSVSEVIDALRRDGVDAVDASVARLAKLGPRAATLLGQADRKAWSPDLIVSVDTVLAQISTLPAQKSENLLNTPGRLIDLLYWPDLSIRRAAAKRLETPLGTDRIRRFDPAKDPYAQATLIESFRAAIPAAKPAPKPVP